MAKVNGSYTSILKGVSQQVPEQRIIGQHGEQINMLSDPVTGLARRRGSENVIEFPIASTNPTQTKADLRGFIQREFKLGTQDYSVLYRKVPKVASSSAGLLYVYNKTSPAVLPVTTDGSAFVNTVMNNGVSAFTQIGRYVLFAGVGVAGTTNTVDVWAGSANTQRGVVWIRGGAYSRTYKITIRISGVTASVSYTTPSSAYPGVLDTSDIPAGASDYQKQVNDRVNAYNSAVTAWIGTASAAIQPINIAQAILTATGGSVTGLSVVGSTLCLNAAGLEGIDVDDGGDGTLARAVYQTVPQASDVSAVHWVGKVVKVQAKDDAPAYYLKAIAKTAGATGFALVTWEEANGDSVDAGSLLLVGTVEAGTFYLAAGPNELAALLPAINVPLFLNRVVGDKISNKSPYFLGRVITYLGVFQDRLVIGSGAVLSMSETGNYFNFFRTSVLTVVDSDPVEVFALGSEDDTIRHSVIYDKSMLLFGDEQQYIINGRVPVTPATTVVVQSSAYEGTTDAKPISSGDFVFYFKQREQVVQAYQIALGQVEATTESTEITQQLNGYMSGVPVEAVAFTSPDMLLLRSSNSYSSIYAYRYLDAPGSAGQQRIFDSWSRWDFAAGLGDLIGMSDNHGLVNLYWSRQGLDAAGQARTWLVVDKLSLLPNLDKKPYLDSARKYSAVVAGASTRPWHTQAGISTAWDNTQAAYLQGTDLLTDVPGLIADFPGNNTAALWSGMPFDSRVTLTNPYRRDRDGVALVSGRLTITRLDVSYRDTAALNADVVTKFSVYQALDMRGRSLEFKGRILGAGEDLVGIQPVVRGSIPVMIGRETREYAVELYSYKWMPTTITAIEWTGQAFFHR